MPKVGSLLFNTDIEVDVYNNKSTIEFTIYRISKAGPQRTLLKSTTSSNVTDGLIELIGFITWQSADKENFELRWISAGFRGD